MCQKSAVGWDSKSLFPPPEVPNNRAQQDQPPQADLKVLP